MQLIVESVVVGGACFSVTRHVAERMVTRSISPETLAAVLRFGRSASIRGAEVFALGRREIRLSSAEGIDLSRFEGTQVVVSEDGAIVTAYRNRDFDGLRPRRGGRPGRRRGRAPRSGREVQA